MSGSKGQYAIIAPLASSTRPLPQLRINLVSVASNIILIRRRDRRSVGPNDHHVWRSDAYPAYLSMRSCVSAKLYSAERIYSLYPEHAFYRVAPVLRILVYGLPD